MAERVSHKYNQRRVTTTRQRTGLSSYTEYLTASTLQSVGCFSRPWRLCVSLVYRACFRRCEPTHIHKRREMRQAATKNWQGLAGFSSSSTKRMPLRPALCIHGCQEQLRSPAVKMARFEHRLYVHFCGGLILVRKSIAKTFEPPRACICW